MISKFVVKDFLNRDLADYDWMKVLNNKQIDRAIRDLEVTPDFHTRPFLHQKVGFLLGVHNPQFLFLLDMGVGKTKITLDLISYIKKCGKLKRALILVPNSVNIEGWEEEWEIHAPHLNFLGLEGSSVDRWVTLEENPDFDLAVINYQGLAAMVTNNVMQTKGKAKGKNKWVIDKKKLKYFTSLFNFVAFDESTVIKKKASLYYRVCHQISKNYEYRYALTGTPFGRFPIDLWSQFYAIDHGETLGGTLGLFREAFFEQKENYWSGYKDWIFNKDKTDLLHETLKNKSIYYESKECQDLPPKVFKRIVVTFPEEARQYYEDVLEQAKDVQGDLKAIKSAFLNMRTLVAGYLTFKDGEGNRQKIIFGVNPKIEALLQLIEEMPQTSKIIIFHEYHITGEIIKKALDDVKFNCVRLYGKTKDKKGTVRKFKKDKKCRGIIINNQMGSKAHNFQVANYVAFFETTVAPIERAQGEKRPHRQGQKKTCFYYDIVMKDSIDMRIMAFLKEGKNLFSELIKGISILNVKPKRKKKRKKLKC